MALRNLWRHSRRTILTVSSIAFGLAVILWLQCILAGRNKSMIDRVTSTRTGHLQLHTAEYLQDKAIQFTFTAPETLSGLLPPGAAVAPRTYLPSLLSSGEQSSSIVLVGIDPEQEKKVTSLSSTVGAAGGTYLEQEPAADCPSRQILIGKSLSNFLHAGVGSKLVIMTQAADGTLGNDLFRVKGIYESGSPDMDKAVAYTPLNCAAKVGALQGVHELAIHISDPRAIEPTRAALAASLPANLKVSTWKEAMPSLASVISLNDSVLLMISLVLFIVIAMGIVNVLLIGVFERTREFGVMIALGTTPRQLRSVVLMESSLLAVTATALGTVLGLVFVAYHHWKGFDLSPFIGERTTVDNFKLEFVIFPIVEFSAYVKSVLATLFFVLVAGVYPAFRASRLNPIDAMRAT